MIDEKWDFKHVVVYAEAIKKTYKGTLSSFSYFNKRDLVKYKRQFKRSLYSKSAKDWQKNRVWDYFNDLAPKPSLYYLKLSKLDKKKVE